MTVAITRTELDAAGLRAAAKRSKDAAAARRMLALAMVLEGSSRSEAARAAGMDRQTLRDWVHRYNADGIAGLSDAPRSGRPSALSEDQEQELRELVIAGPDLERDGVVRWRCIDLRSVIAERYDVVLHERTVGKLLRRMGMAWVQPRPHHPKQDLEAQSAFKKTSPPTSPRFCHPKRLARRSRSGSRMKPGSASKVHCPTSGRRGAPARRRSATAAMTPPTCSVRSAQTGPSAPPSSCPGSAARQ